MKKFLLALRKSGTPVNTPVVLAVAEGIVMARDRTLLVEYGGHIKLKKSWAVSLMQHMNFVKRRGSTKAKTSLPENVFSQVRHKFLSQIAKMAHDNKIPPQLVINWDQTGFNIVPSSSWIMEEQGSNTIPIAGLGDKRQITVQLVSQCPVKCCPCKSFTLVRPRDATQPMHSLLPLTSGILQTTGQIHRQLSD